MTGRSRDALMLCSLLLVALAPPLLTGDAESGTIGLGLSGQYPMEFVAEKDVGQLAGYLRVFNDGGTVTGFYNLTLEGQIADTAGWHVAFTPQTFALAPEASQRVNVVIACPAVTGEFTGRIRVSAYTEPAGQMGTGVAEILVPVTVRLTTLGLVTYTYADRVVAHITRPALFTPGNPAVIDAVSIVGCRLEIQAISTPCTITLANVTAPPSHLATTSGHDRVGPVLRITVNETVTVTAVLALHYDSQALTTRGHDLGAVRLYYFEDGEWRVVDSQRDAADHYVWATVNHLSYWTLMVPLTPWYAQWWFWVTLVVIGGLVTYAYRRRR